MNPIRFYIIGLVSIASIFIACNKTDDRIAAESPIDYDALYVVNSQSRSISVIDLETEKLTRSIDISYSGLINPISMNNSMWPGHVLLSPDNSLLVVLLSGMNPNDYDSMMESDSSNEGSGDSHSSHHGGGTISSHDEMMQMQGGILILDAITGTSINQIELEGMSHNAAFSPDEKELWVPVMTFKGKVQIFDSRDFNQVASIQVGSMPSELTFSADGKLAYVVNLMSENAMVIDVATKRVIDTISSGVKPIGIWRGMNGRMMMGTYGGQELFTFQNESTMMGDSLFLGFRPSMVTMNLVMNQLWVTDPDHGLIHYWQSDSISTSHQGSVQVGMGAHNMVFSNDGLSGYVTNRDDGTVSMVDLTTFKEINKIPVGNQPDGILIRYH